MNCPYCSGDSQVVDSRSTADAVRRRRICNECKRRFTTYERLGAPAIKVSKRSGKSEPFESAKIIRALTRVCRDRPRIGKEDILRIARAIEAQLVDERARSIRSSEIVSRLLGRLADLDRIAYNRLAANYIDEDGQLRTDPRQVPDGDAGQLGLFAGEEDE